MPIGHISWQLLAATLSADSGNPIQAIQKDFHRTPVKHEHEKAD